MTRKILNLALTTFVVFSSVIASAKTPEEAPTEAPTKAAAKGASMEALKSKTGKWQDRFLPLCQTQSEKKMKAGEAKAYCSCMSEKHRDFVIKKAGKEPINVDKHLADVLALYSSSEAPSSSDDEPGAADLDIDFSVICLKGK